MEEKVVPMSLGQRQRISPWVFWPPVAALLILLVYSLVDEKAFYSSVSGAMGWISTNFGSFFLLSMFSFVVFLVGLALSRFGNIRFGGDDAQPDGTRQCLQDVAPQRHACVGQGKDGQDEVGHPGVQCPLHAL